MRPLGRALVVVVVGWILVGLSHPSLAWVATTAVTTSRGTVVGAGRPTNLPTTAPRTATVVFLHPNQAKELEACAKDFLKALQDEELQRKIVTKGDKLINGDLYRHDDDVDVRVNLDAPSHASPVGPWAWCVQRLPLRRWLSAGRRIMAESPPPVTTVPSSSPDQDLKP